MSRHCVSRTAATVACLATVVGASACSGAPSPVPSAQATVAAASGGDRPAAVATGREIAAIVVGHLSPDQFTTVGGFDAPTGATAMIGLTATTGAWLYVTTTDPVSGAPVATCAKAKRQLEPGERLLSCRRTGQGVLAVYASRPGKHHGISGYRTSEQGTVSAGIEPAADDDVAERLVETVLNDPRLGYRPTPDVIELGQRLEGYDEMDVSLEVRSD